MTSTSSAAGRGAAGLEHLAEVVRARAAAEAAETRALLAADEAAERLALGDGAQDAAYGGRAAALRRQLERRASRVELAITAGLSEGQLRARLAEAREVRERLPHVWSASGEGRMDGYRVHLVAEAMARLVEDASVDRLDATVVRYAERHTTSELRDWLRRFVARAEPHEHAERAARAREDRQVGVRHGDDGMSELWALMPTLQAATIDSRLSREARRLPADDGRTLAQRRADLLASWATGGEQVGGAAAQPCIDVAVVVTDAALAGETDEPAVSADGRFAVPVDDLRELVADGSTENVFWHRIRTAPDGRTLDHTYLGRFAPGVLARAIAIRDGVCQVPGCRVPARDCDLDHRTPWPVGATSGVNVWALCRRHHMLKSHGLLTPVGRDGPDEPWGTSHPEAVEHGWRLPSGRIVAAEGVPHERPVRGDPSDLAGRIERGRRVDLHHVPRGDTRRSWIEEHLRVYLRGHSSPG